MARLYLAIATVATERQMIGPLDQCSPSQTDGETAASASVSRNACGSDIRIRTEIGLLAAFAGMLISGSAVAGEGPYPDAVMAASCSAADVQAALVDVVTPGGTVEIPSGVCDWGAQTVTLNMQNKNVYLRGAGMGAGGTKIKRTSAGTETFALFVECSNGSGTVEVSDIAFEGKQSSVLDSGIKLNSSCRDFKLHDMSFDKFVMSGIETRGTDSRGVIYNSRFTNNYNPAAPDQGEGYGVAVYGTDNDGPRATYELGSQEAVFIEDNYFKQNRHSVTSNQNARYVVRHNEFITTDITRDTGMIDAHGQSPDVFHGARSWEVYENSLYFDGVAYWADGIQMRGGDGVVFNNVIGGSKTTGYTIAYILRLVTSFDCPAGGHPPIYEQTEKAYVWGNSWMPTVDVRGPTVDTPGNCASYFREGQEYFLHAPDGYVPYFYPHPLRGVVDKIFKNGFE